MTGKSNWWSRFFYTISGRNVVDKIESKHNGRVEIVREFGKYRIETGNITQSGSPVALVWKKAVEQLAKIIKRGNGKRILILGLGGGTLAGMLSGRFYGVELIGVEIDREMVKMGKKYLRLTEINNLNVVIDDAVGYCKKAFLEKESFDAIFVDLYRGHRVPSETDSEDFFKSVVDLLAPDGLMFVNRLYFDSESRMAAEKTINEIEKVGSGKINLIRTYTNLVIAVSG